MWKRHRDIVQPSERVERYDYEQASTSAKQAGVLSEQIDRLSVYFERNNFAEYVRLLQRPRRLVYLNLLSGISRGVGIAIGFTIIAATMLYLLQELTVLHLPIIGHFIAEIVKIVQAQLHTPAVP